MGAKTSSNLEDYGTTSLLAKYSLRHSLSLTKMNQSSLKVFFNPRESLKVKKPIDLIEKSSSVLIKLSRRVSYKFKGLMIDILFVQFVAEYFKPTDEPNKHWHHLAMLI